MSPPSTRYAPLRTPSLHRLRTAFSPVRRSRSPSSTSSDESVTSPLTRASSPDSHRSASSTTSSIRALLMLRRKPSVIDVQLAEERQSFEHELEMLEPRPMAEGAVGVSIFGVLDGRM